MRKIPEVRIGGHIIGPREDARICSGFGEWSSIKISRDFVKSDGGKQIVRWFAECPQCRGVVEGFDQRLRLPIRETFVQIREVVEGKTW